MTAHNASWFCYLGENRRLDVEIDTVEGCAPNSREQNLLLRFLQRYTGKAPTEINVEVDDVISLETAEGRRSRSLALEFLDGPRVEGADVLYILYFDSGITGDEPSRPMMSFTPYPAVIYIDRSYSPLPFGMRGSFGELVIQHEAGHALGAVPGHRTWRRGTLHECELSHE